MKRYASSHTHTHTHTHMLRNPDSISVGCSWLSCHFNIWDLLEGQYVLLANHYAANKTSDQSAFGNKGDRKYW